MKLIEILDETEFCFVIHKAPGVSFHKEDDQPGVMQLVRAALGETNVHDNLHPVHRLDKVTSGIMLVAKGKEAAARLSHKLQAKDVSKWYTALSNRKPSKKQGLVVGDMVKSRRGSWKLTRNRVQPARTRLYSASVPNQQSGLRCYLLQAETGKTHQLRVAMKSIGAPILGDPLYAAAEEASAYTRTYLHATYIAFEWNQEPFEWVSLPTQGKLFQTEDCQQAIVGLLEDAKRIRESNGV